QANPAPRFNGEVMRGFGLRFDGLDRFVTTQSVDMAGVGISRSIYINRTANLGRWVDTFPNTTKAPNTIKGPFGGQSGMGTSGANSSAIVNTSSGDTNVAAGDSWVEVATPTDGTNMVGGPQITVLGTASTNANAFEGAITFAGNWLHDTFNNPLSSAGHERNFQAYVNTLTLPPGRSRSLLHFVVLGGRVTAATSAEVRSAVEGTASRLAASPEMSDLTAAEICSIANFNISLIAKAGSMKGFRYQLCADQKTAMVRQAPAPKAERPVTSSRYDVVEKTIGQLRADME